MSREAEIEPLLLPLWPDAGRALGFRSRGATYDAAAKGFIRVVQLGKLKRVPKRWLDRVVSGDEAA